MIFFTTCLSQIVGYFTRSGKEVGFISWLIIWLMKWEPILYRIKVGVWKDIRERVSN